MTTYEERLAVEERVASQPGFFTSLGPSNLLAKAFKPEKQIPVPNRADRRRDKKGRT